MTRDATGAAIAREKWWDRKVTLTYRDIRNIIVLWFVMSFAYGFLKEMWRLWA